MPLPRSPADKYASDTETRDSRKLKRPREDPWQTDLKSFKNEMLQAINSLRSDMSTRITKIDSKLDKLGDIEKAMEFLTSRNEELTRNVSELQVKMIHYDEYIQKLETHIEDLSRNAISSNVEIRNVPKQGNETKSDLKNYVQNLFKVINCDTQDIRNVYRWATKKEGRPAIVVELNSTQAKLNLLKAAKFHNKNNPTKRLSASHLGMQENSSSPVFFGEQLTNKSRRLFYLGRQLVKDGSFKFCWTSNGKVYLRKCDGGTLIPLKNEEQIEKLKLHQIDPE